MNKIFALFLCLLFLSKGVFASHIIGAEIRYEHNGNGNYTFYLSEYKICESGNAPLLNTENLTIAQVGGNSTPLQVSLISLDTTVDYCGLPNSCRNPNVTFPGFIKGTYTGTVNLSPGFDYIISFTTGARSASLINIQGGSNLYVEATLKTLGGNSNNSAVFPNLKNFLVAVNQKVSIPFPELDADGDSIVYSFTTPMQGSNSPVTYNAGYYVTNPLGPNNSAVINKAKKTLEFYGTSTGVFSLALNVQEYRGGASIAQYIKDFSVVVYSDNAPPTYPDAVANSFFKLNTCPGQPHSINLSFIDSTATDSVYITVKSPTIAGFNFTTSTTSGIAMGTANVSWVTPSNLNLSAVPYFYVYITARDNSCPITKETTYALLVKTQDCLADSVWPGDVNSDKHVNMYDPLYIAVAIGQSGPARTNASTNWAPQACLPWNNSFLPTYVNMKHADCDGNGTVNLSDLGAVTSNYGKFHFKGNAQKITAGPEIYLDGTGVKLIPGSTVYIPIKLGDANNTISNIYGVATRIVNTEMNFSSPAISNLLSWIDNSSSAMNFVNVLAPHIIDWAIARTDHQNKSGYGTIGTLSVNVPVTAVPGTIVDFYPIGTKMIDKDGFEITGFGERGVTLMIPFPEKINDLGNGISNLSVIPNPSKDQASLQFSLNQTGIVNVDVTDLTGRVIWQHNVNYTSGAHGINLPASELAAGMYVIKLSTDNHITTIKWVKQ